MSLKTLSSSAPSFTQVLLSTGDVSLKIQVWSDFEVSASGEKQTVLKAFYHLQNAMDAMAEAASTISKRFYAEKTALPIEQWLQDTDMNTLLQRMEEVQKTRTAMRAIQSIFKIQKYVTLGYASESSPPMLKQSTNCSENKENLYSTIINPKDAFEEYHCARNLGYNLYSVKPIHDFQQIQKVVTALCNFQTQMDILPKMCANLINDVYSTTLSKPTEDVLNSDTFEDFSAHMEKVLRAKERVDQMVQKFEIQIIDTLEYKSYI